jgi:hypothetical protein
MIFPIRDQGNVDAREDVPGEVVAEEPIISNQNPFTFSWNLE